MNRAPILFRVDGTPELGWERLTRCMTYAAALQRRRRPTYFLSRLEPRAIALPLKRIGNQWLEADDLAGTGDDLNETLQEIRRLEAAAVVVDSASVSEEYLLALRATGVLVMSFDHLANLRLPAQLIVNPLLAPNREALEFHPGAQLLLGKRYALVRSEVRRARQQRSQEPPPPFRALVALGDDDGQLPIAELVQTLLAGSRLERLDLVVRPWHPQLEQLQQLAAAHENRLLVATEPSEITARIPRCHFALTSGGNWSVELACVGVPQLVLVSSEAYWPNAQRLEDEGCAICLGTQANTSAQTIRQAINSLLDDPFERQAMSRCGRKLIDGRGPDRLVTALEVMLHPSRLVEEFAAAA